MAHTPIYPTEQGTKAGKIIHGDSGVSLLFGAPQINLGSGDFVCTSCSKNTVSENKEYKDEGGCVVAMIITGGHTEFQLDGYVDASVARKKSGDTITISMALGSETAATYVARVTSWNEQYSNEDAKKVSVSARTYPALDNNCDPDWT